MSNKEKLKFNTTVNNLEDENPQQNDDNIRRQKAKDILITQFNLTSEEAEEKLRELEGKSWAQASITAQRNNGNNSTKPKKVMLKTPENYSYEETIVPQHILDRETVLKQPQSSKPINKVQKPIKKPQETKPTEQQKEEDTESEPIKNKFKEFLKDNKSTDSKLDENKLPEHIKEEKDTKSEETLDTPSIEKTSKKGRRFSISNLFNKKDDAPKPELPESEQADDIDAILGKIVPNYSQDLSIELQHVNLSFEVQKDQIDNLKEQVIRTLKRNKSKSETIHVLKDMSFKIYQGEKVGIIGYNGAGKSTLLKLIVGIYKPDDGCIKVNGKISPLLILGAGFDHNFSGAKNIYLNGAILGYDREFIEEKYDEIVEFADLGESINYPLRNYSSGMKAKLGFSIATLVDPDILIIDEILGVGDVNFQRKSKDKMKSLMGGKTTVLLVSHSIGQIREICDKAIWIDDGRVREIGEVNEVCDHYLEDSKKATKEQLKDIQFN